MKTLVYFDKDVRNVTFFYYDIILKAAAEAGFNVVSSDWNEHSSLNRNKDTYIFVTDIYDFFKLFMKGYRNFIYWFQGIVPEEHFMLSGNRSKIKYVVNSLLEYLPLKFCRYKFFVSEYLVNHYSKKYHLSLEKGDYFIMPCFNTDMHSESFEIEHKYEKNVFCYAGGLQMWQGFDKILDFYKLIESKRRNASLRIYSKDVENAKKLIEEHGISNYYVDCLPPEELDKELAKCKFGFILREDNIVNNVATPTKLAAYVGNGVIPIYTSSIHSYRDLAVSHKYLCCIEDCSDIDPVLALMDESQNPEDVYKDFKEVFDVYFNKDKYILAIQKYFSM